MFLFVFYFQGAQSNSAIEAGIKLMPLALGMLVASPLAGIYADRHGSRALAAIGMLVTAAGLAGMTTLAVHSPYWQSMIWLALVGIGSGMFNSPNTAAIMGVVPANRRGVAAGARTLLQNTGAVLSIAFVLAIVTSSIPKSTLFAVFSGVTSGLAAQKLDPFIANMHTALWVLVATSILGAFVCLLRPSHATDESQPILDGDGGRLRAPVVRAGRQEQAEPVSSR
jgi:MFS family permease